MRFISHYSSSKGNLYTVTAENGARLLIEAGVPWAKLQEALNFNLGGIEGCLLTHEHNDHSHAFKKVMRAGINIYSSLGTWEALSGYDGEHKHWRKAQVVHSYDDGPKGLLFLNRFDVLFFDVQHDVPCLGFVIREKATDEYLLFATDFPYIEEKFIYPFSIVALACNFDGDILRNSVDSGALHEVVGKRIVGSHSSVESVKLCLRGLNRSELMAIHLLHCSAGNLDAEAARREISEEFMIDTFI